MSDYPRAFYDELKTTALPSARRVVPLLRELMSVERAVDVGCGDGGWLKVLAETGTQTVLGLDGDWVRDDQLLIPPEKFLRCALGEALPVAERFDLAISLEVAEHLPQTQASGFVKELTRLAPIVLFSAAIPGQGGLNHVNEQWPAYWSALFEAQGFQPVDTLRWRIWDDDQVTWWYKQNLLLFAANEALTANPALAQARDACTPGAPPSVVHPERYQELARQLRPGFGRWLKMGRGTIARSLGLSRARRDRKPGS